MITVCERIPSDGTASFVDIWRAKARWAKSLIAVVFLSFLLEALGVVDARGLGKGGGAMRFLLADFNWVLGLQGKVVFSLNRPLVLFGGM